MTEHHPTPQQPAAPGYLTAPPARSRRTWPWWAGIAAAAIIGLTIGAAAGGSTPEPTVETVTVDAGEQRTAELDDREAGLDERAAELNQLEDDLAGWERELTGQAQTQSANTIGDGIWTVGVDIEPGTYRATDVGGDCYWATLVTGTNGSEIVDNGIPGGGNPTVTLEEGQDFETSRCGEWTKQ